jgi:hypothetical protein
MLKRNITKKNVPEARRPSPPATLLTIEWAALAGAAAAGALLAVFPIRLFFPDTHSSAFALEHYLAGILLAALLIVWLNWRANWQFVCTESIRLVRQMLALCLIVFLHFNFKLWAMLVNPYRFDESYFAIDQALTWLDPAVGLLNLGFSPLKALMPDAYHDVFVAMFLATFLCFAAANRRAAFERGLLAVALVLLIGGLAYLPFPAFGPFIYQSEVGSQADRIQQDMLGFMQTFVASHGKSYVGGNFIMPLAAMPSLHLAHAFVLLYYAWRHLRWLGYLYLPAFLFLASEAVASRWHYLIDLPAGLAIALLCIAIADRGIQGEAPKSAGKKSV